ncbi:MAG: FHA domain-containing protein [Armatimonadia bacterium]
MALGMAFGIIILFAKYLFLGLIYLFLYWAFKGLFAQMGTEPRRAPQVAAVAAPSVAAAPQPTLVPPPAAAVPGALPAFEPAPARTRAYLLVQDAGESSLSQGQTVELTAAVTIGRAEDNGVVVKDKFCSGHHALIFLQGGQRLLRDRGSTNGTFHNGERVTTDVALREGDRVGIGTAVFEYHAGTQ